MDSNIKKDFKVRFVVFILFAVILIYLIGIASGFYKTEYSKKPVVKNKVEEGDLNYLYNFYVTANPNIKDVTYIGSKNASITMIVYMDFISESSAYFISNIFPDLKKEYIDTGKLKYYHKNYITLTDIQDNTANYGFVKVLLCVKNIKPEYYQEVYLKLFNMDNPIAIGDEYNIQVELNECLKNNDFSELLETASEIENYGMIGIKPRFYIGLNGRDNTILDGVQSYAKIKRTIRNMQLILGD